MTLQASDYDSFADEVARFTVAREERGMAGDGLLREVLDLLDEVHREGHSMVVVAVDDALGGALELCASVRPEVPEIIKGLRARGIRHIAIISAITRRRHESWPRSSASTAISRRSCRRKRPITSRNCRRKAARSASSATASTTPLP